MEKAAWEPHFQYQELWVLNTAYKLFGPSGPHVSLEATHIGRFDELAKPPNAAVRLLWADAAVCIEGDDMNEWIRFVGKNAPSEQQMAKFLWPNIYAAWKGPCREEGKKGTLKTVTACAAGHPSSRSLEEAMRDWSQDMDKPTPGVTVWKYKLENEDLWMQHKEGSRSWWDWPRSPTAQCMSLFLDRLQDQWGLLLDVDGTFLRCFSAKPISQNSLQCSPAPKGLVTVLGGPKGITTNFKAAVQQAFCCQGVPLLEVSLGPQEQMAHACVAHLRLQNDAGLLRAAVSDLLHLGRPKYEYLLRATEAAGHRLSKRFLGKKLWRGRITEAKRTWKENRIANLTRKQLQKERPKQEARPHPT
eukprot:symbB.v1.2.027167.t1/scaffold2696.1/size85535/12